MAFQIARPKFNQTFGELIENCCSETEVIELEQSGTILHREEVENTNGATQKKPYRSLQKKYY